MFSKILSPKLEEYRQTVEKAFANIMNPEKKEPSKSCDVSCDSTSCSPAVATPCVGDVLVAEQIVKEEMKGAKIAGIIVRRHAIDQWRKRSKGGIRKPKYAQTKNIMMNNVIMSHYKRFTKPHLVDLCMQYKDQHASSCNVSKIELAKKIAPYVKVIEDMVGADDDSIDF